MPLCHVSLPMTHSVGSSAGDVTHPRVCQLCWREQHIIYDMGVCARHDFSATPCFLFKAASIFPLSAACHKQACEFRAPMLTWTAPKVFLPISSATVLPWIQIHLLCCSTHSRSANRNSVNVVCYLRGVTRILANSNNLRSLNAEKILPCHLQCPRSQCAVCRVLFEKPGGCIMARVAVLPYCTCW